MKASSRSRGQTMEHAARLHALGFPYRIPVAVLGATGAVGQRFLTLLSDHPWFRVESVWASERSAGKHYRDAAPWIQAQPVGELGDLVVGNLDALFAPGAPATLADCPIVFSALDAAVATAAEQELAERGHLVVSNTRSHRMAPDVPLIVPEVNPDHLELARERMRRRGGAIITNPNCSTSGLVLALKPLLDRFGLEQVHVVTLQAISGAGLPGVPGYAIADNVIPLIPGEEEKLENEPRKILGTLEGGAVRLAPLRISAQCNRVDVVVGHTLCLSVKLARRAELEEVEATLADFSGEPQRLGLPSAPRQPIHYLGREVAPQPRLHRDWDGGMATTVGRLRPCPLLDYRLVALSHNTLRGAAGGAVLLAELAVARGLLAEAKTVSKPVRARAHSAAGHA